MLDAAYAVKRGQTHSPEQLHGWKAVVDIAEHFKSADKYLLLAADVEFQHPV